MHPSRYALTHPDKPALVFQPSGIDLTYLELEQRVRQAAHLLQELGVGRGDAIAFCIENSPEFFGIAWASQRIGAIFIPLSTKLSADDMRDTVEDSKACAFILSVGSDGSRQVKKEMFPNVALMTIGGTVDGFGDWKARRREMSTKPIAVPASGREMMYSSGTKGLPKGVREPLPKEEFDDPEPRAEHIRRKFMLEEDSIYLLTSPLYHSAPYVFVSSALRYGATCVVMEQSDAESALHCIQSFRCTHTFWDPTMFHRTQRLPLDIRRSYDIRSLRCAIHGAAPCAVGVKEGMIDWWGPILFECEVGTEQIGASLIFSKEWLTHNGSVGRATHGELHILAEQDE